MSLSLRKMLPLAALLITPALISPAHATRPLTIEQLVDRIAEGMHDNWRKTSVKALEAPDPERPDAEYVKRMRDATKGGAGNKDARLAAAAVAQARADIETNKRVNRPLNPQVDNYYGVDENGKPTLDSGASWRYLSKAWKADNVRSARLNAALAIQMVAYGESLTVEGVRRFQRMNQESYKEANGSWRYDNQGSLERTEALEKLGVSYARATPLTDGQAAIFNEMNAAAFDNALRHVKAGDIISEASLLADGVTGEPAAKARGLFGEFIDVANKDKQQTIFTFEVIEQAFEAGEIDVKTLNEFDLRFVATEVESARKFLPEKEKGNTYDSARGATAVEVMRNALRTIRSTLVDFAKEAGKSEAVKR